ncbi:hypothetical protein DTO013E5_5272 [Penicillium roqueforti]|uniref:Genomic scaffold, ProqFM164S01 n=1 Tax=Penicillium roqueforti (strain FM164) TaxID=1365484 RepID=W6Q0A6_PENRF|nr:hypothetical protein CBS147337_3230 [Penicillium roqueforti]CDM29381.1 unnamed protein product [Penicillium roqueforti FM164]KAI2683104.1 hypothetical protein CBS147355_2244 [Penicillium roqueforti]KAI2701672.1 hypothetical protein CBS147372_4725 [Penicillium roqueforti]KAI2715054.1 hypothetical protein CBS147354_7303 [Penicillium roqueforti]
MNTTIREENCKSVDLDGFGSTADDAWFDYHTAPMDGEEETGAHPHQVAAFKAYMKGDSTPSETAAIMTKPHDPDERTDIQRRHTTPRTGHNRRRAFSAALKPHARPHRLDKGNYQGR